MQVFLHFVLQYHIYHKKRKNNISPFFIYIKNKKFKNWRSKHPLDLKTTDVRNLHFRNLVTLTNHFIQNLFNIICSCSSFRDLYITVRCPCLELNCTQFGG